jgi:hypothetical protein
MEMAALLMMFHLFLTPFMVVLDLGVFFAGIAMAVVFSTVALAWVFGSYLVKHYTRQLWRVLTRR